MPQYSVNPERIFLTNHAEFDFNNEAEVQRLLTALDIPKSIFTAPKWAVSYLATKLHPKLPVKLKSTHHHENDFR
jgi:predicted deacetylase